MRIIARRTLPKFVETLAGHKDQPAVKPALDAWFDEKKKARWAGAAAIKRSYATASIVTVERIVFNVKGTAFRLVLAMISRRASSGSNGSVCIRIMTGSM